MAALATRPDPDPGTGDRATTEQAEEQAQWDSWMARWR